MINLTHQRCYETTNYPSRDVTLCVKTSQKLNTRSDERPICLWVPLGPRGKQTMYTVAALIVMAIALGGVMAIVDSVLNLAGLSETVRKLPLIGAHLDAVVAIGLLWLLDIHIINAYIGGTREEWMSFVLNGIVIAGFVPVKDAIVGAVGKGMRA